ncbi:hypothetical protein SERLADRAFT_434751 [Serpula lacrymans var. lacrymans S7.9]|uniref:Multidrug resistance-associated ABC transporter n=1 Tax=Serpula lacrymans var. lacrymans (strain S7.9) TaxID=578457 RepID=F8NL44_SERL9|nr:uncharacterized protein SERLADRAFT_434751 [Serpula lacrymans var. lacrymans S7.9]EGO28860.1 hypothetical protein SERLADRAFT_434751 [Serpula lacrymans var. lacrymans S7.9]
MFRSPHLCADYGPFDFRDACVRRYWSSLVPVALVLLFCVLSLPSPAWTQGFFKVAKIPRRRFITIDEAEALELDGSSVTNRLPGRVDDFGEGSIRGRTYFSRRRNLYLSWIALLETFAWSAVGIMPFSLRRAESTSPPVLIAITWFYASLRPIIWPSITPPFDLFSLYITHLMSGILLLGGVLYEAYVWDIALPSGYVIASMVANIVTVAIALVIVLGMPLAIPSTRIRKEDIGKSISPEDYTSLWGWITFCWVYPLIKRGTHATLNEPDVWNVSITMQSRPTFVRFMSFRDSSLLRRIWVANAHDLIYAGPFFLKRILDSIDDSTPNKENRARAYIYAFIAFACTVVKSQCEMHHLWFGLRAATRMRSELMAAIYDKALKRKDFSGITNEGAAEDEKMKDEDGAAEEEVRKKTGADIGKIVNLMAGDVNTISQTAQGVYLIYGAPFELIICLLFLYQLLGLSAFAGVFVVLAGLPINSWVAKRSVFIQKNLLAARDKRMSIVNEVITALKFIKFFAWEDRWINRTFDARKLELSWMIKSRLNYMIFVLLWQSAPLVISVIAFSTHVFLGNQLTIGTAFTAITLFNMLALPLNLIPLWTVRILQANVALGRIATFLDEDEVDGNVSSLKRSSARMAEETEGFGIDRGSFIWNRVDDGNAPLENIFGEAPSAETAILLESLSCTKTLGYQFKLKDISVMFPDGKLTVVTGPTASGKTALLMALLGEMTALPGSRLIMSKNPSQVDENGLMHAISYSAQAPWLRHQSIKDNILFDYPYDEERYQAVIEYCALKPDLAMLEDGDATEIGARGVSLSGGQKARVALARAVYARTKYVLLDDPLSAVDSHTARFLFHHLLCGPLLKGRTVVLVTHHTELVLPGAHYLVRMSDGHVDLQGVVKDLRALGILDVTKSDSTVQAQEPLLSKPVREEKVKDTTEGIEDTVLVTKKSTKLIQEEHRETGSVKWSIYKTYLHASSYWTWFVLWFLIIVKESLGVAQKLWIRAWGEAYDSPLLELFEPFANETVPWNSQHYPGTQPLIQRSVSSFGALPDAGEHPLFFVGIYGAIGCGVTVIVLLCTAAQYIGGIRASRRLFSRMFVGVVRATMRWHDTTPQGRMLNRFGKDMETIDSTLSDYLAAVNTTLASFAAAIVTVAVFFPSFLIPAFFISLVYRQLAIGYLNTGRDLRRMESNSRSPIFSGFSELLEGIVTVRAFSAEKRFLDDLHVKIDKTTMMWYNFWMTNRWLLLNFDILGGISILVTTLIALYGLAGSGLAGICITSAMSFTFNVYWACQFWTGLELDLNSVERVVEYLDLPQEPPAVIESNRPPAYWPSDSAESLISVQDLVIKYAPDLPPVLNGLSFTLKAKERVGILGRTGSGKSTLAMSILRFVDPSSGRIVIDGIDTSTIGLHDLRSRLTFIPQDATLFSGTLRDNLDPFGEHGDSECLDALYRVQMISEKDTFENSISSASRTAVDTDFRTVITLDMQVSAGGANFSQGQRQLIALARALLRRSSIVILDEATSSIDFATDAKIQMTIREEFNGSLLLTVAHRLQTVIDYDRLLVLDKGKVAEFDTPLNLLNKEDGIFRDMCLNSGMFDSLKNAAKAKASRDAH